MIQDMHKFRLLYKLKSVYRLGSVDERKESVAEHSWSVLLLADFFLSRLHLKLDRLKVYELLMYHDVVEIYAGDTPLHPDIKKVDKHKKEKDAAFLLKKELPFPLNDKFFLLFEEFEAQKTLEAKFAKAVDALDAELHELDYKEDWVGWSKDFLIEKKARLFEDFPALKKVFFDLLVFLEDEGYFKQ